MSPKKIVISPGQGLLLLMELYKNDFKKMADLKKLYLLGAEDQASNQSIRLYLEDNKLSQYQISFDKKVINDDPTRRYFETHLSYETLVMGLDSLDHKKLATHCNYLLKSLPKKVSKQLSLTLSGHFKESHADIYKEYADYIERIQSKKMFPSLNDKDREKVLMLVKSSFLGVINAVSGTYMPLNIYDTGLYSTKNKGKSMIDGQETTRNQNLGLMKGHMPLALTDIAHSINTFPLLKPSDQASFVENAEWVEKNFSRLVMPFSNSISGTMLCQLRASAMMKNKGHAKFCRSGNEFGEFSKLMVSAMLFNSGGHTLYEFTAPFEIKEVQKEFMSVPGFQGINLESMFLTGNEKAFDLAIEDSIIYNHCLLKREVLHQQLTSITSYGYFWCMTN